MSVIPLSRRTLRRAAAAGAVLGAAAGVLIVSIPADAATGTPIVYSESTRASGRLDGVSFTNAAVTIAQSSNTADVVNQGTGFPRNRTGTVTVTVAGVGVGVGSDTLTYATSYVNQAYQGSADFGVNGGGGFGLWVTNARFAGYNLDRAFGPITGPAGVAPTRSAITSRGNLTLTSAGTVTFRAVTS